MLRARGLGWIGRCTLSGVRMPSEPQVGGSNPSGPAITVCVLRFAALRSAQLWYDMIRYRVGSVQRGSNSFPILKVPSFSINVPIPKVSKDLHYCVSQGQSHGRREARLRCLRDRQKPFITVKTDMCRSSELKLCLCVCPVQVHIVEDGGLVLQYRRMPRDGRMQHSMPQPRKRRTRLEGPLPTGGLGVQYRNG